MATTLENNGPTKGVLRKILGINLCPQSHPLLTACPRGQVHCCRQTAVQNIGSRMLYGYGEGQAQPEFEEVKLV